MSPFPVRHRDSPLRQNPLRTGLNLGQVWATMKFDFQKFYEAVNAKRTERAASWRQVAREIGIGKSTLARMAQNKRPDADGLAALSFWANLNPADFVFIEPPAPSPSLGYSASALRTDSPPSP
jgi:hypothetical protein